MNPSDARALVNKQTLLKIADLKNWVLKAYESGDTQAIIQYFEEGVLEVAEEAYNFGVEVATNGKPEVYTSDEDIAG